MSDSTECRWCHGPRDPKDMEHLPICESCFKLAWHEQAARPAFFTCVPCRRERTPDVGPATEDCSHVPMVYDTTLMGRLQEQFPREVKRWAKGLSNQRVMAADVMALVIEQGKKIGQDYSTASVLDRRGLPSQAQHLRERAQATAAEADWLTDSATNLLLDLEDAPEPPREQLRPEGVLVSDMDTCILPRVSK